ncbi:MAG TPA: tRNA (adenosine(37)-N6)-threonylcarbamoyltransferase complex dimerization subunit type 1 TsaB [Solirubrobacteraceae bacterium]|nr:tRNA (adenosine(37)-N6)-threonylcarbamoyltransferase complex dimerization subunit type 1 TsaB [Solirubrobacteraceae bacterium]
MILLGFDTATPATVVGLLDSETPREAGERRHEPAAGERPGHASQLLALAKELLAERGLGFADVDRIAVGLGPGTFTGLRIGVATARALAQAAGAELVGVSTLRALAAAAEPQAPPGAGVLAVVDARRREVFAAGWRDGREVVEPVAVAPAALADRLQSAGESWLAVGDGALRFRSDLEESGCLVAPDDSPLHGVAGGVVCRLALEAPRPVQRDLVVPEYLRPPDAARPRITPT